MPAARHQSPQSYDGPLTVDAGVRKRVCKACDRCRLKKSKCDGVNPCGRCRADNGICVFGERKKSIDKVYPKGYVEMLEQQQSKLMGCVQIFYRKAQDGEGWPGEPLKEGPNGQPLIHDILDRLGVLKVDDRSGSVEPFEEDMNAAQQRLFAKGASTMQRQDSTDGSSEDGQLDSALLSDPFNLGPPYSTFGSFSNGPPGYTPFGTPLQPHYYLRHGQQLPQPQLRPPQSLVQSQIPFIPASLHQPNVMRTQFQYPTQPQTKHEVNSAIPRRQPSWSSLDTSLFGEDDLFQKIGVADDLSYLALPPYIVPNLGEDGQNDSISPHLLGDDPKRSSQPNLLQRI